MLLKKKKSKRNIEQADCGGRYTLALNQNLVITSPNYPNQYYKNQRCNYFITSPIDTKIKVKLNDIDLEESSKNICIDGLEIRYYSLGQPGPV